MSYPPSTPAEHYAAIVEALTGTPNVTLGSPGKKGVGASALCIQGKIFAMLAGGDRLVVKLPRQRVDALIAAGAGEHFDPGHGRLMKEWIVVAPAAAGEWLPLAREALAFVDSKR